MHPAPQPMAAKDVEVEICREWKYTLLCAY